MDSFTTDNTKPAGPRSIYERAAYNGLWMGLYFVVLFLLMVATIRLGVLNILVMAMICFTPFLIYRQLKRTHLDAHGMESFSGLWMQGILTFCCGSIILCAASYIFLRWCYPTFMYDSCLQILDMYKATPEMPKDTLFDVATAIVEKRFAIRPTDIALAYLWSAAFTGSILSMILATVVKLTKIKK